MRSQALSADLFLKNVPTVVKELIGREATENRRSINQEAIALLEEALLRRVEAHRLQPHSARELLRGYADSAKGDLELPRAVSDGDAPSH